MPVYVDDARIPWRGMRWCHMVADTAEELYAAAAQLGLSRELVQDKGRTLHYDLPDEWRERAIELGVAEPITWRELARRRQAEEGGKDSLSRANAGKESALRGAGPAEGSTI